jgi:hypothetical protein
MGGVHFYFMHVNNTLSTTYLIRALFRHHIGSMANVAAQEYHINKINKQIVGSFHFNLFT